MQPSLLVPTLSQPAARPTTGGARVVALTGDPCAPNAREYSTRVCVAAAGMLPGGRMPPPYRWIVLAVCMLAFVQVHIHRLAFSPLIPTFVADLGISYATAATIQTAYFWTYTVMQVPVGVLTDRWGARRVMLVFLAGLAAGALVGLGAAAVWVPGLRLIAEWFAPVERGRVTGLFSAAGGVGGTVA